MRLRPELRVPLLSAGVAAAGAVAYLAAAPPSQDLAAATFRAELFDRHGLVLWNGLWYSGHHLLSYSVLFPPLGALLGVRLTAALAVVAAAAAFGALAAGRRGEAARPGTLVAALWFAAGAASWLLTGRVPFLLALPFGLGALLAARRSRSALGAGLAGLCSLASPVGGLFLALAGAALALAGERARGAWLVAGAGLPILALNLAFPVGGEEPFVASAFVPVPLLALAVLWLVPAERRALRAGAVLYALLALAVFAVPNPLGGNVTRLGALFAGPAAALVLWPRSRVLLAAVALPLLYWQLVAPLRDLSKALDEPATERAFFTPLVAELDRRATAGESFRVEIPPTRNRWEAAYVAPRHALARGWLRQLESDDFDLFTDGRLDAAAYRAWLAEHAITYVAVPEAELDYLAEDEVALIESGLPYLAPVWSSADWTLFRVAGSRRAGLAGLGVELLGPDRFALEATGAGEHPTSIEWTPHWSVREGSGCVHEAPDGRTLVATEGPGRVVVEARLGGERCSG